MEWFPENSVFEIHLTFLSGRFLWKKFVSVAGDTSRAQDRYRLCKADRDILLLFGTSRVTLGSPILF
jgi:hypothetical protein